MQALDCFLEGELFEKRKGLGKRRKELGRGVNMIKLHV
jgi:hypothetical protein